MLAGGTLVAVWLPALAVGWPFRRWLHRGATPLVGGVAVQSWRRAYRVPWDELRGLDGTPFLSRGRGFAFSHTLVAFAPRPDAPVRTMVVSASFRSGLAGAMQILGWLPPDHPARQQHGEALRIEPVRPLQGAARRRLAGLPVLESLRPTLLMRLVYLAAMTLCALMPGLFALGLASAVPDSESPTGFLVAATSCGAFVAFLTWVGWRFWRVTVQLTSEGLIYRGLFSTRAYDAADVHGFALVPAGAGQNVHLVLRDGLMHDLYVGASFGRHGERTCERLEAWRVAHRGVV